MSMSYFLPLDSPPSLPLSSALPYTLSAIITSSPSFILSRVLYTMLRKKNALEFFRRGKEKGSEEYIEGIDSSTVYNKPIDKVLREYYYIISL